MKNSKNFLFAILLIIALTSYANAAATCREYCIGKGYDNGYCFNYDDSTRSEDPGWVEHGAHDGACSKDLTKCNYAITSINCHHLDEGSKNICGDCSAMHANIYCTCYKTMDCTKNCRSECKSTGCNNSQEIQSDSTCGEYCKWHDCGDVECTGGACVKTPGLGEMWSGGVCYFSISYVKNQNCEGATGAAGYCACWRSDPCPDTSAEGLEGMAENKCDANRGCTTGSCAKIDSCGDYTKEQCASQPCKGKVGECVWNEDTGKCTEKGWIVPPEPTEPTDGLINNIKTSVYIVVVNLYCIVLYIATAVAALFVVITGIKYMSSDDGGSRAESRNRMAYAVIGLAVIALACPLVNMLFGNTNIGIPDSSGKRVPCPGCPYLEQITSTGEGISGGRR